MQRKKEILWRQEKYRVMYHSQKYYDLIRKLMRNEAVYEEVWRAIDEALQIQPTEQSMRNALQHMAGYFKKCATQEERKRLQQYIAEKQFQQACGMIRELANAYEVKYLQESSIIQEKK